MAIVAQINPANPTVTFETSYGDFKVEVYVAEMPKTAASFLDLCEKGFYNGLRFHKCKPGFAVQGGCPNSAYRYRSDQALLGTGAPEPHSEFKLRGTQTVLARDHEGCIEDEFNKAPHLSNTAGAISMSNCGPGTAGSQFFINLADNTFLDWWSQDSKDKHTVFARVLSGVSLPMIRDSGEIYKIIVD